MLRHTSIDELEPGDVVTAGRLCRDADGWHLANARARVALRSVDPQVSTGALCRVHGRFDGSAIAVESLTVVHHPAADVPAVGGERSTTLRDAFTLRQSATSAARAFFDAREFLHVDTPRRVDEPGTDIYLEPLPVGRDGASSYLHTSPEFAMKQLLALGFERIWQLTHVWRGGEHTPLHHPEFSILEWYRAWEPAEAIMADVEGLARALIGETATIGTDDDSPLDVDLSDPFEHMTMQEVVRGACGFDLLDALDHASLVEAARAHALLSERSLDRAEQRGRWDELFFELQVTHIDPFLADRGAVFVTEWPAQLAVLARRNPEDPRVAERFELYVGGIELANGFHELTDPVKQRERFEEDIRTRRDLGLPTLPMPDRFVRALEYGLPPSSGVAVGFDRLLMLASGASHIREVLPYARL